MLQKMLASLLTLLLLMTVSWSQEDESAQDTVAVPATDDLPDDAVTTIADDASDLPVDYDLDDQNYAEGDDVFVPTEEIPSDEAIPFPSDI